MYSFGITLIALLFGGFRPFCTIFLMSTNNKLRRSAYLCTPSGKPKLKLWLSLLIPKLFSYPYKKMKGAAIHFLHPLLVLISISVTPSVPSFTGVSAIFVGSFLTVTEHKTQRYNRSDDGYKIKPKPTPGST